MGLVKKYIGDLTWAVMEACNIEDDVEALNYDTVFQWVMGQNYAHMTQDEIISQYKKENDI